MERHSAEINCLASRLSAQNLPMNPPQLNTSMPISDLNFRSNRCVWIMLYAHLSVNNTIIGTEYASVASRPPEPHLGKPISMAVWSGSPAPASSRLNLSGTVRTSDAQEPRLTDCRSAPQVELGLHFGNNLLYCARHRWRRRPVCIQRMQAWASFYLSL